ncbi:MAG: TonB-dependent receptor [Opitutales bacterium]|nr:TonB-dependent receptor [bacterium]MDG2166510.1 TonB-dependent receptor [Opitutales bacterium]
MNIPKIKDSTTRGFLFKILALMLVLGNPYLQAQEDDSEDIVDLTQYEVIGSFSESLVASLDTRREATQLQDSIFAEDMGKFPDLNLAEALQRLPGVAIQRDNGEGRRIQIRGLGSDFVRVLLNGVPLSTASSGRSVDFDVFPSELFTRVSVNKTAKASDVEGGISGVVNLRNARPFDFHREGLTVSTSFQMGYNDLSENWDPRGHILATQTFNDGKFGLLAGVAASERNYRVDAQETLDWGAAGFGGVIRGFNFDPDGDGVPVNESGLQSVLFEDWVNQGARRSIGDIRADPTVDLDSGQLEAVRIPRLQRTDLQQGYRDRTGFVVAAQFRPQDRIQFNFDFFSTELDEFQERHELDVELRNQADLVPINFTVSPENTLLKGTLGNADRRSESREIGFNDKFEQFSASMDWNVNDLVTVNASFATNTSEYEQRQQTYLYEIKDSTITFDYTVGIIPAIASNVDVLDPNNYNNAFVNVDGSGNLTTDGSGTDIPSVSLVRNRVRFQDEDNTSFHLDTTIGDDAKNLKVGFAYDAFERNENNRDRNFGPETLFNDYSGGRVITNEAGTKLLSDFADGFGDILGQPSGAVADHVIADFPALDKHFTGGNRAVQESAVAGPNDTPRVEEENMGLYLEVNTVSEFLGKELRFNAGVRGIRTFQTSQNKTPDGAEIFIERDYTNVLPSFNIAWDAKDDVVLRLSGGQTMTRPSITQLQAATSFSSDFTASSRNPFLNPFLSDQVDLTAEWYYAQDSLFAFNFFYKSINGFIESQTRTVPFSETGININDLDPNIFVELEQDTLVTQATTVNSDEVREISGVELILQQPLDFLTEGLGFYGNYSFINSSDVTLSSGNTIVTTTIQGLSENLFNLVLFYERETFAIRGSYNWRDSFSESSGLQGSLPDLRTRDPAGQLDISASYNLPGFDDLQLTLEAVNLTDEKEFTYFGVPERNRRFAGTGKTYFLGVRGTF